MRINKSTIIKAVDDIFSAENMLLCAELLENLDKLDIGYTNKKHIGNHIINTINNTYHEMDLLKASSSRDLQILSDGDVSKYQLLNWFSEGLAPLEQIKYLIITSIGLRARFTSPIGPRVDEAYVREAMSILNKVYSFSENVFSKMYPIFLLYNNGNSKCNNGTLFFPSGICLVEIYHIKPTSQYTPQYIFLHEMGHMVHTAFSSTRSVPSSFLKLNTYKQNYTPDTTQLVEFFADAFAFAAIFHTKYKFSDILPSPDWDVEELDRYFSDLLAGQIEA